MMLGVRDGRVIPAITSFVLLLETENRTVTTKAVAADPKCTLRWEIVG